MAQAATAPKKVGGAKNAEAKPKKEKKPKVVRADFSGPKPAEGFAVAVPEGYSFKEHKPLKKKDFASTGHFLGYKAEQLRHRGNRLIELADKLKTKSERILTVGDDQTLKAVKKVEKMQNSIAELMKQLAEQGIDVQKILGQAKAE